ncbi:MAG: hypothetical protein ABSF67_02800 [Roseiarcus sp.]|jgi:hypothetical protein
MLNNVNDARAHAAFLRGLSSQSDFAEDRAAFAEIAEFLEHIIAGRLVVHAPRAAAPDDETAASGAPVESAPPAASTAPSGELTAAPSDEASEAGAMAGAPAVGDGAPLPSEPSA